MLHTSYYVTYAFEYLTWHAAVSHAMATHALQRTAGLQKEGNALARHTSHQLWSPKQLSLKERHFPLQPARVSALLVLLWRVSEVSMTNSKRNSTSAADGLPGRYYYKVMVNSTRVR